MTTTALEGSAIREIERLVTKATPIIRVEGEARGVYFIRQEDGTLARQRTELDEASFLVRDLASLTLAVHEAILDETAVGLFVDDGEVVLPMENEDGTHRWHATLPLPTHPAFALVSGWMKPTKLTQKELLRVLRTQLSLYVDATVIATLAALKFNEAREGASQVGPTNNGLSRTVQQRVSSENGTSIPEYLLISPPVYDIPEDRNEEYDLKVYLEYDFDESVFVLVTVSDDVRKARERAVARVIEGLRQNSGDLTVLYGQPK